MLGFAPASSQPISGDPFKLTTVATALAATVAITFAGTARIGAFIPMVATVGITFGGSPTLFVNQAIGATVTITFGGSPTLFIAGKPIKISAVHENYDFRAMKEQWTLKALPESFAMRAR